MQTIIPFEGRVRMIIRSSFVSVKRQSGELYSLSSENFHMSDVRQGQVLLLPDEVQVVEGQVLSEDILAFVQSFDDFVTVSAEDALPNALGLLLRIAVADGRLSDAELLTIQPALEGRVWSSDLSVEVGDVYSYAGSLWRCVQAHVTQADWTPDLVPALWRKIEVLPEDAPRVWQAGVEYVEGDVLAYPDVNSELYECLQGHASQTGWEPPNTPALWKLKEES